MFPFRRLAAIYPQAYVSKDLLMKFADLGLAETLLRAVETEGYHTATPVQIAAIPPILAGRDVLACAQTGTGKTAAFAPAYAPAAERDAAAGRSPRAKNPRVGPFAHA